MIREEIRTLPSLLLDREVTLTLLHSGAAGNGAPHLLVLNDGQDLKGLQLKEALASLNRLERLEPVLVAGVHAGERMKEYGTAGKPDVKKRGAKAAAYTKFILEELLPDLQQHAGVERFASTAIAGCSLGALSAMDIAWHHPDVFDRVGAFSGSFWWRSAHPGKDYSDDRHRIMHQIIRQTGSRPDLKFWLQAGTQDESADRNNNGIIDAIDDTIDLIRELEQKGYRRPDDIRYVEVVGGRHDLATWAKVMPHFLHWAFGK